MDLSEENKFDSLKLVLVGAGGFAFIAIAALLTVWLSGYQPQFVQTKKEAEPVTLSVQEKQQILQQLAAEGETSASSPAADNSGGTSADEKLKILEQLEAHK
jgi:flagellar biosynthesis/type III secretory pathway M-ring protein FliF/YscJ